MEDSDNQEFYPLLQTKVSLEKAKAIPNNLDNKLDPFDLFYVSTNPYHENTGNEFEIHKKFNIIFKFYNPKYYRDNLVQLVDLFFVDKKQIMVHFYLNLFTIDDFAK